ncbi:MAG: hypothetical protein U0X40_08425 [Ferruginibacter sp.]
MKQFLLKHRAALAGITGLLLTGLVALSFEDTPLVQQQPTDTQYANDTIPEKENRNGLTRKEFDKLGDKLDDALLEATQQIKKVDWDEISSNIAAALKAIDSKKIIGSVEKAMATINPGKILEDVRSSMKAIDWTDNRAEFQEAMKKMDQELERARVEIKEVNRESLDKAMKDASAGLEKARRSLENIDFSKISEKVNAGLSKAKEELKQSGEMFDEMEKDGLIRNKDGFSIEYKDKELFINGKKQPEAVTDKYRKYFKRDHYKIRIDKE